ncbi:MAG TPA: MarR family transcriptional regulator [Opitutaceae bacterium]
MKGAPATLPVTYEPLPGSCFCGNLRRATRTVTRVYEEEFRSVGFTGSTQYNVLRTVGRAETICQRDLGKTLGVDETTLTRTLKPLLQKGWIVLKEGADRREKIISLSKSGHTQIELAHPAWNRAQARIRKVLPAGLWASLMEALPLVAKAGETA